MTRLNPPASAPSTCIFALVALIVAPAHAACVADTPIDSARWFFQHHYHFFRQHSDEAGAMLSPALREGMESQWRCVPSEANCPLIADPWTGVTDGAVRDPVVFSLRTSPLERTRVAMRFVLARGTTAEEPATAELVMVRDAAGCFVLDELIGAAGSSLRGSLSLPGR